MNVVNENKNFLYLDHAASSTMFSEVNKYIFDFNSEFFGNPSSIHKAGINLTKEIEKARDTIANIYKVNSESVFFTSGGTEANNWIIYSLLLKHRNENRKIVLTSEIEHPSVLKPLEFYSELFGYEVKKVKTMSNGQINLDHLNSLASDKVLFCTVMQVNNETGSVLQIKEIGEVCKKYSILFHVDACQGFLKCKLDNENVHFITINSHKVHGPKGIGALISTNTSILLPLMIGGGHEMGYRSGTLNASAIVGFKKAIEIFLEKQNQFLKINFKKILLDRLMHEIDGFNLNGSLENSSDYILNFSIDGVHAKEIFKYLNGNNIFVSTSSACSSRLFKPSYVLEAMGISEKQNFEAIRISFSPEQGIKEIDYFMNTLKEFLAK